MTSPHPSLDPHAAEPSDLPDAPWRGFNDFGVMLALDGHWEDAHHAFTDARDAAPARAEAPDVHALLESNIAQACFHTGDVPGAIDSARASLAARLQCGDADDAPTARARADLAVYLAAAGAVDEARATLQDALRVLEDRLGADDPRLTVLRINAARLARLTAASPMPDDAPAAPEEAFDLFPAPSGDTRRPAPGGLTADTMAGPVAADPEPATDAGDAVAAGTSDAFEATDDYGLDLVDEFPPRPASPSVPPPHARFETAERAPSTTVSSASLPTGAPPLDGLGFVVEYGVPQDLLFDGPPD